MVVFLNDLSLASESLTRSTRGHYAARFVLGYRIGLRF